MKNITAEGLIKSVEALGYPVFKDDSKPFNLTLVGVRSSNPVTNKFNCMFNVLWPSDGQWNIFKAPMTSLPGLHWLLNPMNPKGCAILKEGHWKGVYKITKHRGKYDALCQRLDNVTVHRDGNRDRKYDMVEGTEMTGKYGINIHRAHENYELETVNKYSAGCQVIQDPAEFAILMALAKASAKVWGNSFSYTLINENNLI